MRIDVVNYGPYENMNSVGVNLLGSKDKHEFYIECVFPLQKGLKAATLKKSAKQTALEYLRQAVDLLETDLANDKSAD